MKKKKVIPLKNYIKLALICIITLFVVFYANSWYKTYQINKLNKPYISDKINAINYGELDTYLIENQSLIVYVGKNNDNDCYEFEKKLYDVLKDNNLLEETIFLDLSDNYNSDILNAIKDKYYVNNTITEINSVPSLMIINNQKVTDVLTKDNDEKITSDKIVQFLTEFEYIK